jgi:serine/threonine protein kinase
MSGRINPVLKEALKSARKKELERKRKTIEREEAAVETDLTAAMPRAFGDRGVIGGENLQKEELHIVSKMAPAESAEFRENKIQTIDGGEQRDKARYDKPTSIEKVMFVTDGSSPFKPEADIKELESDSEGEVCDQTTEQNVTHAKAKLAISGPRIPERCPPGDTRANDTSKLTTSKDSPDIGGLDSGEKGEILESLISPKRRVSMLNECRDVHRYEKLNRISEGTYGIVYRGRDLETGAICALKKLKIDKEQSGFPLTSVREINILLALEHPNIVNVSEVVMGHRHSDPRDDQIFMVMEYADHDLSTVMQKRMKQPFTLAEVKCLMIQLLSGVAYLHENWVLHRDLKTANILYTNKGQLKICDFGLARQYSSFPRKYTQMVVTLWYRAPELLLGTREYSPAIDVWSVGCIMGELLTRKPILPGKTEIDQLQKIYDLVGNPDESIYSDFPLWSKMKMVSRSRAPKDLYSILQGHIIAEDARAGDHARHGIGSGVHLLQRLLDLNPKTRISAREALSHPWFSSHPLPKDQEMMPTFKATNDSYRI